MVDGATYSTSGSLWRLCSENGKPNSQSVRSHAIFWKSHKCFGCLSGHVVHNRTASKLLRACLDMLYSILHSQNILATTSRLTSLCMLESRPAQWWGCSRHAGTLDQNPCFPEWNEGMIDWEHTLSSWASVHTVSLDQSHEDDLDSQGGNDRLCVDQRRVAQVVEAILSKDLCSCLEPDSLSELDSSVLLQQLWGDASKSSQHGLQTSRQ